MLTKEELRRMVDHTNLNMDATNADIERLCTEAVEENFFGTCVRPWMVKAAAGTALIKYINENSFLTNAEIALASKIVENARAECSKSNTGMGASGALPYQLEIMSGILSPHMAIKIAGSVSNVEDANRTNEAAQRYRPHRTFIGTSKLISEYR